MQGPITDRTTESLGVTDVGIILYRKILEEQLRVVEDGGEPMNVHREDGGVITLPQEHSYYPGRRGDRRGRSGTSRTASRWWRRSSRTRWTRAFA